MTLKNVKIKVPEGISYKSIIQYLESLGYVRLEGCEDDYKDRAHYYGDKNGRMSWTDEREDEFFKDHDYEEIFLPTITCQPLPPIGLRPKAIVDALRIQEILEAMTRYVADGKAIPQDWIDELSIRNSERSDYAG